MAQKTLAEGVVAGRLAGSDYAENFADIHPNFAPHEAAVAADRCYFCYDAPCVTACPTAIDIPMFIRQISTGNALGAAKTIFDQNILGGMCARVCPTETLCEQACVREHAEGKPVNIGRLQRFATDKAMAEGKQFYTRSADTGKRVAVVGAGPAGLACAHRLAMHGHRVTVLDANPKAGGLNEYGIAAYKTTDDFAAREVDYITAIGGITIETDQMLGRDFTLSDLQTDYDAVFLGMGLGGVNALALEGDDGTRAMDAVAFIADLRQAEDLAKLPIGRRVVVIGGGMTAIDAAVQAKLLGADEVTVCYRRGQDSMNASGFEQDLAAANGVVLRHWLQPKKLERDGDKVVGITFEHTGLKGGKLSGTGQMITLAADQIFRAIGQSFDVGDLGQSEMALSGGRIKVDASGATSIQGIWAGGDCTDQGEDLTVTAVAQGRDAAEAMHKTLMG